jgi:hypothetical protein
VEYLYFVFVKFVPTKHTYFLMSTSEQFISLHRHIKSRYLYLYWFQKCCDGYYLSSMAMFRVSMFRASIVGFVGTTVGIVITLWRTRSKIRHRRSLSLLSSIDKKDVEKLRLKHFAKSLTVSYANTGPLMIVEVCSQCYLRPCGFTLSP